MTDLIGQTFGHLTVIARMPNDRHGTVWLCVCVCGKQVQKYGSKLRRGFSRSCGCKQWSDENHQWSHHGHSGQNNTCSRTYRTWANMKSRCANARHMNYPKYGARGIRVCDRWQEFVNFLADMGEAPAGLSIDRIDNEGDYEPSNCRWATPKQQRANRRQRAA